MAYMIQIQQHQYLISMKLLDIKMGNSFSYLFVIGLLLSHLAFSLNPGAINQNDLLPYPITYMGAVQNTKFALDYQWRWIHSASNSSDNCLRGNQWNPNICPDPKTCWDSCAVEGVPKDQWKHIHGIKAEGDTITLKYVTHGQYGVNVGSRVFLMDPTGQKYLGLNMLGKQISFQADMSNIGCGLNGAIYFAQLPLDGGPNLKDGNSASYGMGYCDAQCKKAKFIQGKAEDFEGYYSVGACCAQFDLWYANSQATLMSCHVCKNPGLTVCENDKDCGREGNRFNGVCDMDGADYNPYRAGQHDLFGKGQSFKINTNKPFTVKTQFITDNGQQTGNLIEIKRIYIQDGKTIEGGSLTDQSIAKQKVQFDQINLHEKLGGLKALGEAFKRNMSLIMRFWDDEGPVRMLWMDGTFPFNSSEPGAKRGPCPQDSGYPQKMRKQVPNSHVIYSNIKIDKILHKQPSHFEFIQWLYEFLIALWL